jgi:hypothetical protein
MNNNATQFPIIDISYFTPSKNKDGVYVPGVIAKTTDLYKELHRFKEGYYSYAVEQCRSFDTKAERDDYKVRNINAVTFSCFFKENDYRKGPNIVNNTNIMCIDIDDKGVAEYILSQREKNPNYSLNTYKQELFESLPCIYAGLSVSGTGLFLLIRYEGVEHLDVFLDIQHFFDTTYGVKIDASCKDLNRLRFATYDTTSYIKPWDESSCWKISDAFYERKKKIDQSKRMERERILLEKRTDVTGVIIERAVSMIKGAQEGERHHKIRAASRLLGGYIASNVINEIDAKEALMNAVIYINYDDMNDARKAIDYGMNTGKLNPIEIQIITPEDPNFDYFTEQTETRQKEISQAYAEIIRMIRKGIPLAEVDFVAMAGDFFLDVDRLRDIAKNLYVKFDLEFGIDHKPLICKVESYLRNKYDLRTDVITQTLEGRFKGIGVYKPLKFENIWRDLQQNNFKFKFDDLSRLMRSEFVDDINPWEVHFSTLVMEDNTKDYIGELANYITLADGEDKEFFKLMFKKMLVRCVKCGLNEHYANRYVLVLASQRQSNGKSSLIRWLNPFGPHQYYAENPLEDNKDARIRMAETFIYNLEELSTSTKSDINRLKATISQIGTRDRKPYGRQAENIVRRCNFFGSTNNVSFLTDDTNTRWLCFQITKIDWAYSSLLHKDNVWAQAYKLYRENYDCELTEDEAGTRDAKNEAFSVTTVEQELIYKYFTPAEEKEVGSVFMTSTSITQSISELTQTSRMRISSVNVGRALGRLKFVRTKFKNVAGYWVKNKAAMPAYYGGINDGHYNDIE